MYSDYLRSKLLYMMRRRRPEFKALGVDKVGTTINFTLPANGTKEITCKSVLLYGQFGGNPGVEELVYINSGGTKTHLAGTTNLSDKLSYSNGKAIITSPYSTTAGGSLAILAIQL